MIRHILRRGGYTSRRKRRKSFYPAHWAWEEERPFALVQVDVKDILDKGRWGQNFGTIFGRRDSPAISGLFSKEGNACLEPGEQPYWRNLLPEPCAALAQSVWD